MSRGGSAIALPQANAARYPADIRPYAWCSERFLAHVSRDWTVLS